MNHTVKRLLAPLAIAATLLLGVARADDEPQAPQARPQQQQQQPVVAPTVDLVICLDTSGSMEGLIDACRRKLWDVCALVAQARPTPSLRVALLTFGNDAHPSEAGWVNVDVPFTTDLDLVYQRLMALGTNGGTELVGRVVHHAMDQLAWSDGQAMRVLFVAGNESADQDPVHRAVDVAAAAHAKGVVVHAIYCGPDSPVDPRALRQQQALSGDESIAAGWRAVARAGGGHYAAIDQQGTVSIPTPFDDPMARLSVELNATYLPFGHDGARGCSNQMAQDANSSSLSPSTAASRAEAKASGVYRNDGWDLVDARQVDGFDWAKIAAEALPEALRAMTPAQRDAHLAELRARRADLQTRIQALAKQRAEFIAAELVKQQGQAARSLDAALFAAVREQAQQHGLRFE